MKLAVWGPLPPSRSGIADYLAEQLTELVNHAEVQVVVIVEDPSVVDAPPGVCVTTSAGADADLDLYQLGNSPAHAYVYRRALAHPGVVLLHDWNLHHLVLSETVERGRRADYLRLMRRANRDAGAFLGRQVAMGLGGRMLPALFPLNEPILDSCLAVVGLNNLVTRLAERHLGTRPVLHLPHHLSLPLDPLPSREQARSALGLEPDALLVTAPGLATDSKRLDVAVRTVARLKQRHARLRLIIAGGVEPGLPLDTWARQAEWGDGLIVTGRLSLADFVRHLVAADVVLALRFPSHGEMSGAALRALGVGRPVLVTAGSAMAEEFAEGVVAVVDPGTREEPALEALLERLLGSALLRTAMGRLAREHVLRCHNLAETVDRLVHFLAEVHARKAMLLEGLSLTTAEDGGLEAAMLDEVRWCARELGLSGRGLGLEPLILDLCRPTH